VQISIKLLEEVVEAGYTARRPSESLFCVPQIAHDETVLPSALFSAGAAQVAGRRRSVVHGTQAVIKRAISESDTEEKSRKGHSQMAHLVGGDNDAGKAAGVFDDGHAVDLLKALVHHAGTADVRETLSASIFDQCFDSH
jgi:hypothetical protein